jgi:hypothetical protein
MRIRRREQIGGRYYNFKRKMHQHKVIPTSSQHSQRATSPWTNTTSILEGATMVSNTKYINISRYTAKERPTCGGIAPRFIEWSKPLTKIRDLHLALSELKQTKPRYSTLDHANQTGTCNEYNPFGLAQF